MEAGNFNQKPDEASNDEFINETTMEAGNSDQKADEASNDESINETTMEGNNFGLIQVKLNGY